LQKGEAKREAREMKIGDELVAGYWRPITGSSAHIIAGTGHVSEGRGSNASMMMMAPRPEMGRDKNGFGSFGELKEIIRPKEEERSRKYYLRQVCMCEKGRTSLIISEL
jgi:hypothetical protein